MVDNTMNKVKDPVSEELQNSFKNYYRLLYLQPPLENELQIEAFLNFLNVPTVISLRNIIKP